MIWYGLLVAAVAGERVAELVIARRNQRWSTARGAIVAGQGHYPAMVALHTGLLIACPAESWLLDRPFVPALAWPMLAVLVCAQALRWWCIHALGPRWNTRVMVVPGLPLVTSGPYGGGGCDTRTMRPSSPRAWPCRWCTPPGSPPPFHLARRRPAHRACPLREPGARRRDRAGAGMIDVLVAGGGPAGLAAAIHAALAGLEAVVIEPRTGPVDKACGEGVMPGGVAALRTLGVEVTAANCAASDTWRAPRAPRRPSAGEVGWESGVRRCTPHCSSGRSASVCACCRARSPRCTRARTR